MSHLGLLLPRPFGKAREGHQGWLGGVPRRPHPPKMGLSLSPLVPPNIEPGPLNKAVLENASVTLECLASGVPPPGKTPPLD